MDKKKFFYIDDDREDVVMPIVRSFNDFGNIQVERFGLKKHQTVDDLTLSILDGNPDGIILDFRLDGDLEGSQKYTAMTLAQDIRTKCDLEQRRTFPIIICSTYMNLKPYIDGKPEMRDLFDLYFTKEEGASEVLCERLDDLANAYLECIAGKNLCDLLNKNDLTKIDPAVFNGYATVDKVPTEFVRYFYNNLIQISGPLITEGVLAARLGIDKDDCQEEWKNLLSIIECVGIKYAGILSKGWRRFWNDTLLVWFKELTGKQLYALNAKDRVAILQEKLNLYGLIDAKPIEDNESTYFNTVCSFSDKPLDSMEGFEIMPSQPLASWQEPSYYSLYSLSTGKVDENKLTDAAKNQLLEYLK